VRIIASLLLIIGGLYLVLLLFLYFYQSSLIFMPSRHVYATPESVDLGFEDVTLDSDGTSIHGWFVSSGDDSPVVLFCHGNAGNVADRVDILKHIHAQGLSVLIFDYAGYGRSEGRPSEVQANSDARSAYDYLIHRGYLEGEIIVYGRSMGGGVAATLAQHRPVKALALEATFTSLLDVARLHYAWFPVGLILSHNFDVSAALRNVKAPVVIIQSPDDELIPYDMARTNFETAREPKRFISSSGGHNTLAPVDWGEILSFLKP
jgi:pimeloyl-ACP methyl ester carboxylesterase